jgi:predicted ferric reductase
MTLLAERTKQVHTQVRGPARWDARVRVAAVVGLWASLLFVTYLWVDDGGLQDLTSWETALNSLGRITGLVASDLLLVQVLLIARIPVLERAFGQDRILRQHRVIGFTSFSLMLAHILLNTWGYAGGAPTSIPGTFWDLTTTYPGMLLAVAGTACLIVVVVTSVKVARRRLRYESWHLLHLYAYLGAGLALPHQLWTGQQFLDSPAATVFWWSFWALAALAVLVYRVALPLWRTSRHDLRVTSVVAEGDGVTSVYMKGRAMDRLRVDAGQFFIWRFLGREGWSRGNPYSLSAAPDGRSLRISVKALGDNSARTPSITRGTAVQVEGPYGRLSQRARTQQKVAFIGAGVGIAPLRALAEGLDYFDGDAVMLYRFTDSAIFQREFAVLARERGLAVNYLAGSRRSPDSWLGAGAGGLSDVEALQHLVPDLAERDVFVCGPQPWTDSVRRCALAAGLPAHQFHVECFGW